MKKEGEVYGDNEAVPDSFLIIDNSPSMFMPNGNEVIAPSKKNLSAHCWSNCNFKCLLAKWF